MVSGALPLLGSLSYADYPHLITSSIQKIAHSTSVLYSVPEQILSDFWAIGELYNVQLHCIISRFWAEENQHVLVFLDKGYRGELVLSPSYPYM